MQGMTANYFKTAGIRPFAQRLLRFTIDETISIEYEGRLVFLPVQFLYEGFHQKRGIQKIRKSGESHDIICIEVRMTAPGNIEEIEPGVGKFIH
jgi:hypothetical protein